MTEFPLYDPLDDQQIEDFRRRLRGQHVRISGRAAARRTQGPAAAVRRAFLRRPHRHGGLGHRAEHGNRRQPGRSSAWASIERWQTKRGPAENPHIIDWIEFDTDFTIFPDPDRDNFGPSIGLWDYNFVWHVGDRLTLLSDGIFDFFDQGQKIMTMGMFLTRPPRGAYMSAFACWKARSIARS